MTGPDPVAAAWTLIDDERIRFEAGLADALHAQRDYLSEAERMTYRAGKKLRPLLLLLAARMCVGGEDAALPDKAIQAAVSLEMLHTATLIHDDIIDEAARRRGAPSVAAARGLKTAILIGDLQFVQAIRVFARSVDTQSDMQLVNHILDVGFKLCCGELDELDVEPGRSLDEQRMRYFRTIDRKTATLFGFACEAGASLAGAPRRTIMALSEFGWNLGRAFQIMDDVLDFLHPDALAGKAAHADLLARRATLPIIFASGELADDHVLHQVMRGEVRDSDALAAAARAVADSKGLVRAYALARSYVILADRQLDALPPGRHRAAAKEIAFHVVDRRFLAEPAGRLGRPHDVRSTEEKLMAAPDPILQFFLTLFYKKAIDPTSEYYLPKLIQSQTDPVVEPYVLGGDWNNVQIGATQAGQGAQQICLGTAPGASSDFGIPTQGATPLLNLVRPSETHFSNPLPFQLVGLSNMLAAAPVVSDGDNFSANATLGTIGSWPIGPLQIQGNFIVDQSCCLSEDLATCLPNTQFTSHGEGTFDATFATAQASVQASATVSPNEETLTVTVNSLGFTAQPSDLSINIVIMSVQNPDWRKTWSKVAEEVFRDPGTKQAIIAQIGQTLNSESVRQSFQNVINNALASMFGGGALQEHARRYRDATAARRKVQPRKRRARRDT